MSGDPSGRMLVAVTEPIARSTVHWCASLIENLAGVRVEVLELEPGALWEADARLTAFLGNVGVLFLPHASPEVACQVRAMAGVPVLTGQDTTAIALAAAVSTTLARTGRAPGSSQVVIAGADALRILCPLLMVGGASTVTTWNLIRQRVSSRTRPRAGGGGRYQQVAEPGQSIHAPLSPRSIICPTFSAAARCVRQSVVPQHTSRMGPETLRVNSWSK